MENRESLAQNLTVIVPAWNEADYIVDTVHSILNQTTPPARLIVVDDFSDDCTGEKSHSAGAEVLRAPKRLGSKAAAQNYALTKVTTKYVMAIDADTTLETDAIEKLLAAFSDPEVVAACGLVVPRYKRTLWERGRYVEYLFAFTFAKRIQDYFGKPLISSGCFSVYQTNVLKQLKGWNTRTLAEDMDLTWTFYENKFKVRFIPEAVSYPVEPYNYNMMAKQLKRWSHGFIQNVKLHWKGLLDIPVLRSIVSVGLWDALVGSVAYLILIPALIIYTGNPLILLVYVLDLPALAVPVLYTGMKRKELLTALTSIPSFFVLRIVNSVFMFEALWSELIVGKKFAVYEKGH